MFPPAYLAGLGAIVLSNVGALTGKRKRATTWSRRRKVAIRTTRGLYHPRHRAERAWIELFVDRIIEPHGATMLRLPAVRDYAIGGVLFHELGHHIHATHAREFAEREDVADRWRDRLLRVFFRWRLWYLRPLAWPGRGMRALRRFLGARRATRRA